MPPKKASALAAWRAKALGFARTAFARWPENILSFVETALVASAGLGLLFVGWWLFFVWLFDDALSSRRVAALKAAVETLGQNWQVILLALLPIFYRPVRAFAEEAYEAFGVKRRLKLEAEVAENPPERAGSNGSRDA